LRDKKHFNKLYRHKKSIAAIISMAAITQSINQTKSAINQTTDLIFNIFYLFLISI